MAIGEIKKDVLLIVLVALIVGISGCTIPFLPSEEPKLPLLEQKD